MDEEISQSEESVSNSSEQSADRPDAIEQTVSASISGEHTDALPDSTDPLTLTPDSSTQRADNTFSSDQPADKPLSTNPSADNLVSSDQPADKPFSTNPSADNLASSDQPADKPFSEASATPAVSSTDSAPDVPASASDSLEYAPVRSAFPADTNAHRSGDTSQPTTEFHLSPSTTANYDYSEPEEFSTGYATASLVLGILSLFGGCCCCIPGTIFSILGIVFGCLQKKDSSDQKPGMAIAGIVLSGIGLLISFCSLIYFAVTTFMVN